MLNRVILMGRITQDLEVRQTPSGNAVLRFNVAVDRPVRQGAERQTDFITCTAWGQRAEFINRYFSKGIATVPGMRQVHPFFTFKLYLMGKTEHPVFIQQDFLTCRKD